MAVSATLSHEEIQPETSRRWFAANGSDQPTEAEYLTRCYVAGDITIDEFEHKIGVALARGIADARMQLTTRYPAFVVESRDAPRPPLDPRRP